MKATRMVWGATREPVRARLRSAIERLLAGRNYPTDQEVEAINLVLKQMEHFANEWSMHGVYRGRDPRRKCPRGGVLLVARSSFVVFVKGIRHR